MATFNESDVLRTAPNDRTALRKAVCGSCGRSMHKTPLIQGTPTEWRHDSSGAPLSWSPARHLAGIEKVSVHAHRWVTGTSPIMTCSVAGCDSEMAARPAKPDTTTS